MAFRRGASWRARIAFGALVGAGLLAGCGRSSLLGGKTKDTEPPAPPAPAAPEAAPRFDCRASERERPMLAARVGTGVYFAHADGTVREVHRFDLPEGSRVVDANVVARGERVAVYVVAEAAGGAPSPPPFAELVVLDVEGALHVRERLPFDYEGGGSDSRIVGAKGGPFVLSLLESNAGLGLVVGVGGGEPYTFTEPMAARSDPDARGRLVVLDYDGNSTADLHFFDTRAKSFTPSRYVLGDTTDDNASSPTVLDSGLLYLLRDPARLVFEDADGTSEVALDVTLESPGHASPGHQASGGWRLFALGGPSPEEVRYLVTHFATGATRELRLAPPAGFVVPGDSSWNAPPIDARGRLLVTLSDGTRHHLHATEDGVAWEPIGRPIAASGYPTTVVEAGGAVVFDGFGGGAKVPGALSSGASQLVGPQGGEGIELVRVDPGAPDNPLYADDTLSADGGCLAYFRSGSLHVVETGTYASTDLALPAEGQNAEMAWIPLPD